MCEKCSVGWKRAEEDIDLTKCIQCQLGETTNIQGATSCSACGIGQYGSTPGVCVNCLDGQYQSEKKQTTCLFCKTGKLPNEQATGCEAATHAVPSDCTYTKQYLNNTDSDSDQWSCQKCPDGASCIDIDTKEVGTFENIQAKQGFWRVPWALDNITFERCPYVKDCIGVDDNSSTSIKEGCLEGTKGPMCSLCIEGYNRDTTECIICQNDAVPIRITLVVVVVIILFLLVAACKRKIQKKWKKYKPLWRE
jgi:hypothetical protein